MMARDRNPRAETPAPPASANGGELETTMFVETTPKDLKAALAVPGKCVAQKSLKRIFECVRLRVLEGRAWIEATDLKWHGRAELPLIDSPTSGCVFDRVVPMAAIAKLGKVKAGALRFEPIGETDLKVSWSTARTTSTRTIEGEAIDQYPDLPTPAPSVHAPRLGWALNRAMPIAGKEAARFVLNGIELKGGVTATDGHRLYRVDLDGVADDVGLLGVPPVKGKLLDTVHAYSHRERFVTLFGAGFELTGRKMDGTFPDWRQIVPNDLPTVPVDVDGWIEALDALQDVVSLESSAVAVKPGVDALVFSATNGNDHGVVEIKWPAGAGKRGELPEAMGFNPAYLRDFLKLAPTTFGARNANDAARFDTSDGEALVLMPVLLS